MNKLSSKIENNSRCADCAIRHNSICAHCDESDLEKLAAIKTYRTYDAGEAIVWAGDEMQLLGSIVSGVATLSRTLPDGRRQMVGLLLPSDFVGRPGRSIAPFDVVAVNDVVICHLNKPEFEAMIAQTPLLGGRLLEKTMDELDSAREWMLLLGRKTAREKIASLLAILAQRSASLKLESPKDGLKFVLPLTREAMSDYLGLTIETVSRQISALKKDGIIVLGDARQVNVPDFVRLQKEAGDDSDGGFIS